LGGEELIAQGGGFLVEALDFFSFSVLSSAAAQTRVS